MQTGGVVRCTVTLIIGNAGTASNTYHLGGSGKITVPTINVGVDGFGILDQSGDTVALVGTVLTVGQAGTGQGLYTLRGGVLQVPQARIGASGNGTVTQTGGSLDLTHLTLPLTLGYAAGSAGTYNLWGGTVYVTNGYQAIHVGHLGRGILNFGNAETAGTLVDNQAGHKGGALMYVGRYANTEGAVVRGWGTCGLTSGLRNNGCIIGDSYGVDGRMLDFSSMSKVYNDFDNTGTNGWYAVNRGKILLPSRTATATNWWGEDGNLDLVNSVRTVLTGAISGKYRGALLAADRSEIPLHINAIGVWQFDPCTADTATFSFRYDHAAVPALGVPESDLRVFLHNGTRWVDVTAECDTTAKTITTTSLNPSELGYFAVGNRPTGSILTIR